MKKSTSVTIFLNGEAVQCEISRNTSCDDVIKMVTKKIVLPIESKCFAIFESELGEQKMISGQTNLLKHVRSRGAAKHNYTLEVKEVDRHKSKIAPMCLAKSKFQRLKSRIMKTEIKSNQNIETISNTISMSQVILKKAGQNMTKTSPY